MTLVKAISDPLNSASTVTGLSSTLSYIKAADATVPGYYEFYIYLEATGGSFAVSQQLVLSVICDSGTITSSISAPTQYVYVNAPGVISPLYFTFEDFTPTGSCPITTRIAKTLATPPASSTDFVSINAACSASNCQFQVLDTHTPTTITFKIDVALGTFFGNFNLILQCGPVSTTVSVPTVLPNLSGFDYVLI